jgi:hypothetical protein
MNTIDPLDNWISRKRQEGPGQDFSDRVMKAVAQEPCHQVIEKKNRTEIFLGNLRYAAALFFLLLVNMGLIRIAMIIGLLLNNAEKGY